MLEQHNHQKAQQGEGNIAVNPPGKGRFCAEPLILRHHAQHNPQAGQAVHGYGKDALAIYSVSLPPDIVKQHIENSHGN